MKHHVMSLRIPIAWILAAMLTAGGITGCKPEKTSASVTPLSNKTPVLARPVTRVSANRTITVSGELTADKTAPLSFLVAGKVDRILVDEGDHVKRGALLATVEAADYRNHLEIAEATLTRDLERLRHDPEIWLTGMKPGEEARILKQVVAAAPDKNIQMLSRGTVLTI